MNFSPPHAVASRDILSQSRSALDRAMAVVSWSTTTSSPCGLTFLFADVSATAKRYACSLTSPSLVTPLEHQRGFPRGVCRWASLSDRGSVSSGRFGSSEGFRGRRFDVRRHAKFQQFGSSETPAGAFEKLPESEESLMADNNLAQDGVSEEERADRDLPRSLEMAVVQASEATALFVQSGGNRALVELLLPDLANYGEEGDQLKLWNFSRLFLEELQIRLGTSQQLKAVFPDAGVAAMLKYQWTNSTFRFASLNDRKPVDKDDDVVVLVQPDYQMLSSVEKIASSLADIDEGPPRALVMYNPALQSGEVGIGLNVRRMRDYFLSTFNPVYSIRSLSFGAIFRRYPAVWQVFFDDEKVEGRYILASEEPTRPELDDVEMMFLARGNAKGGDGGATGKETNPIQNLVGILSSMSRFMQSLSR